MPEWLRAIRSWLSWRARRDYDRQLARERRHMLHDTQEVL